MCLTALHACVAPGDYWPGEAENLLLGIAEEARQAGKRAGKGAGSKANPAGRGGKKVCTHATAGSAGQATCFGRCDCPAAGYGTR